MTEPKPLDPGQLAQLIAHLEDPLWRICSGELYSILTSDGSGVVPFHPRPEQIKVAEVIYGRKWFPNTKRSLVTGPGCQQLLVPKARRLGMSTVIGVMMADRAIFNSDTRATVIDQNAGDASRKLTEIIKVAVDSFKANPLFAGRFSVVKDNDSELSFSFAGQGKSQLNAVAGARGGTNDFLWVSEWGVIQHEDPKRSAAIRSGALPSARHGIKIVETTWAGGKSGDLWEIMEPSLTGTSDDWEVLFFPWYVDPRNTHATAAFDEPARKYFAKIAPRLQAQGVTLTEGQMRWYAAERRTQGIFMPRENPTFLDEAWSAPVKGAIYATEVDRARAEGRVGVWPVDPSSLVHCAFDLGSPANIVCWWFQIVGPMIRIVDVDAGLELTSAERWGHMLAKPYGHMLGKVLLPHDAESKNATGESPRQSFAKVGMRGIVVIPRTHDVWVGINAVKELFPLFQFSVPACEDALAQLSYYHTRPAGTGGTLIDEPVHDRSSHYADGFRYIAEAIRCGILKFTWGPGLDPSNVRMPEKTGDLYQPYKRRSKPMNVGG